MDLPFRSSRLDLETWASDECLPPPNRAAQLATALRLGDECVAVRGDGAGCSRGRADSGEFDRAAGADAGRGCREQGDGRGLDFDGDGGRRALIAEVVGDD